MNNEQKAVTPLPEGSVAGVSPAERRGLGQSPILNKVFEIALNTKFQGSHQTDIFVNQGDRSSIIFNFRVYDGVNEINYRDVESSALFVLKPNRNVVQLTPVAIANGGFSVVLNANAVAEIGTVIASLALYGFGGERITTLNFSFLVGRDILRQEDIESSTEFDALQRAIALLEGAIRLYEEFPRLNILGYFEFESELLAAFPDGSNINGGFWVGSEYEGRYFFWDRTHNQWTGIDPNRGRTGRHFIPISEPSTAQQLHDLGIRVGDSVVVLSEVETPFLFVAGEDRVMGTVLERVHEAVVDSSFVEGRSIRGARGEAGTNNPRGFWNEEVDDYQRYDTVIFRIDNGYAVFMYTSWEKGLQIQPTPESPNNPWQLWVYPGLKGDAATIEIGTVSTVPNDQPARVENIGTSEDAILEIDIPQGRAATLAIRDVITVEDENEVRAVNAGTNEDAVYDLYILRGERGEADGTMNHTILNNLEFENSGHTGFASAIEISNIEQRIQSITPFSIGAAAETLITGIEIPPNANLNDYREPGNYFARTDVTANTIQNRPPSVNSAFSLSVTQWGISTANAPRVTQTIIPRLNNGVFVRTGTEQPSVFNQWLQTVMFNPQDTVAESLLENGWRLFGAPGSQFNLRFFRRGNICMLNGLVIPPTNGVVSETVITTLPAGFRPLNRMVVVGMTPNAQPLMITVHTNGFVTVFAYQTIHTFSWLSIQVSFLII